MSRRITITIDDDISDGESLDMIRRVVAGGRVSKNGTRYCYLTTWPGGRAAGAELTRTGADTFKVWRLPSS